MRSCPHSEHVDQGEGNFKSYYQQKELPAQCLMRNNGLTSVKHTEKSNLSFTWESNQDRKRILLSPTNLILLTYH